MKTCPITVSDDPGLIEITVDGMSDNINIRGYKQTDTVKVIFTWTSVPNGLTISSGRLEARIDAAASSGTDLIDVAGTVTNAGGTGTSVVEFTISLSVLTVLETYALLITMVDNLGAPRTWVGVIRALAG